MNLLDQTPPADIEAEMAVLGSILRNKDVIDDVFPVLRCESFYREAHGKIYSAMLRLYDGDSGIDVVLLRDELERRGQLENIGGSVYLVELMEAAPSTINAEHYAKIVQEAAHSRAVIRAAADLLRIGYGRELRGPHLQEAAETTIFEAGETITGSRTVYGATLATEVFNQIADLAESGGNDISGLATGFVELDVMTCGFQPGELIVVAGRPGSGKTAFSLNIAEHALLLEKRPVAFFSLEQPANELMHRMICSRSRIDSHKVRKGFLTKADMGELITATAAFDEAIFLIDDSGSISMPAIQAQARRFMLKHKVSMIVIDYLQLVSYQGKVQRREEQIAQMVRGVKAMAKSLEIPVLCLSQLNRGVEGRENHRPRMSDLRESGEIENAADLILFLYRPEMYDSEAKPGTAEVIVGKNRHGPTGSLELAFLKEYTRFENLSVRDEELF